MRRFLRDWINGKLIPEFHINTYWFKATIPFPFWKVLALVECGLLFALVVSR